MCCSCSSRSESDYRKESDGNLRTPVWPRGEAVRVSSRVSVERPEWGLVLCARGGMGLPVRLRSAEERPFAEPLLPARTSSRVCGLSLVSRGRGHRPRWHENGRSWVFV